MLGQLLHGTHEDNSQADPAVKLKTSYVQKFLHLLLSGLNIGKTFQHHPMGAIVDAEPELVYRKWLYVDVSCRL
jgi:hypothetical protein